MLSEERETHRAQTKKDKRTAERTRLRELNDQRDGDAWTGRRARQTTQPPAHEGARAPQVASQLCDDLSRYLDMTLAKARQAVI